MESKKKIPAVQEQLEAWEAKKKAAEAGKASPAAPAAPVSAQKFIAEHKVVQGDTLGGIALKYYGSAVKEKWMLIYEANKAVIGDNPNLIRIGAVLKIPEIPNA
jgi:nucleoid-associated protein YgaU